MDDPPGAVCKRWWRFKIRRKLDKTRNGKADRKWVNVTLLSDRDGGGVGPFFLDLLPSERLESFSGMMNLARIIARFWWWGSEARFKRLKSGFFGLEIDNLLKIDERFIFGDLCNNRIY